MHSLGATRTICVWLCAAAWSQRFVLEAHLLRARVVAPSVGMILGPEPPPRGYSRLLEERCER